MSTVKHHLLGKISHC